MPYPQDYSVTCFGEALWTVLPNGKQIGGSPVRIACHLQQLGMNPVVISRIGYDDLGREIIEMLETRGICTDYFQMDEEKLTGIATAYEKEGIETVYNIFNDVAWDAIAYTNELSELTKGTRYFVYGSLAVRCRESRDTLQNLLSVAGTKVLHLNLYTLFCNRAVVEALLHKADVAVLTRDELELITGWVSCYKEDTDRVQAIQNRFHIPVIAVIDEKDGFLMADDSNIYKRKRFGTKLINRKVNSESFLAGLLFKLSVGAEPEETLLYAAAASVISDDRTRLPYYTKKEIDDLLYTNQV